MKTDRISYRRGVMLGLTLAEIMILILFLLMTVLCILWQNQRQQTNALARKTASYREVVNKYDGDPERREMIEDIVEAAPEIAETVSINFRKIVPFEEIGEIDGEMELVVDDEGNAIGYVDNGKIKDFDDEEIGKINDDGEPVDDDGKPLGKIAEGQKIVKNKKGRPIGYAGKNGIAVSPKGEYIGKVDKNGIVRKHPETKRSANRSIIGYLDGKKARDFAGNIIGTLNKESFKVLDPTGTVLGSMADPGYVVRNPLKTVVGYVTELRRVKGRDSETVGIVDDNGDVFTTSGEVIASVDDCSAIVFNKNRKPVGYVRRNNSVADFFHNETGVADYNGKFYDKDGLWAGHIGRRVVWTFSRTKKYKSFIENPFIWDVPLQTEKDQKANIARLIRNGSGKITGYVLNGKAVSADDVSAALSIRENKVEDADGKIIGTLKENALPAQKDGEIVGFVGKNGHFFDFDDVERGVVDLTGQVLRSSMEKFDHITLAYRSKDNTLKTAREIGPDDKILEQVSPVVNKKREIIGWVDDDMFFVDLSGKQVGRRADTDGKISLGEQEGTLADKVPLIEKERLSSDVTSFLKNAVQIMENSKKLPTMHRMKEEILRFQNNEKMMQQKITDLEEIKSAQIRQMKQMDEEIEHFQNNEKMMQQKITDMEETNSAQIRQMKQMDEERRAAEQKKIERFQNNEKMMQQKITDLEGWKSAQIRQMKKMDEERRTAGQKGRDLPPCWYRQTGEETFEEEPSFHIELTEYGFIVHNISPESRKNDFNNLPGIPLNRLITSAEFDAHTKRILKWEMENDCRFRVKICDRTGTDKDAYKDGLNLIERRFYKESRESCDGI